MKVHGFCSLLLVMALLSPTPASAGLGLVNWLFDLDDVGRNSASDLSTALDRATERLLAMHHELDVDVRDYLELIDKMRQGLTKDVGDILSKADLSAEQRLNQANEIIQNAIGQLATLEKQAVYDFRDALWETECLGERLLTDTLKRALGDAVRTLSQTHARLEIKVLGIKTGTVNTMIREVPLSSPSDAYEEIRAAYEAALEDITPDTSIRFVIGAYDNIARMAKLTSCHYRGQVLGQLFLQDYVTYSDRAKPWALVAQIGK